LVSLKLEAARKNFLDAWQRRIGEELKNQPGQNSQYPKLGEEENG